MPVSEKEDDCDAFYRHHRGGMGAVIVATAIPKNGRRRVEVFSNLDLANAWASRFDSSYFVCMSPHIVDDPDWGNEAIT